METIRLVCALSLGGCFADPPGAEGQTDTESSGSSGAPTSSSGASTGSASSSSASGTNESGTSDGSESSSDDESSDTGVAPCVLSGEWEVVLDDEGAGGNGAQSRGIGGDADGSFYATGNADGHWIVRRTDDRGASWDIVDDFTPGASFGETVSGEIAFAEDGTIFVVGSSGTPAQRLVRRSVDDGASWDTVETFRLEPDFDTYSSGIAIANDGRIFTSGHAGSTQGGRWIIRMSDDGGETWSTDDDYQRDDGQLCLPRDVFAAADGSVLASGHCFDADENSSWTVRRRGDEGWIVADAQGSGAGFPGYGAANIGFAGERLLVAGAVTSMTDSRWTIRMSDDGVAWETLDDWVSEAGGARAVAIYERDDTLFAIGSETGTFPTIVTRRSEDDGATWERIDTYTFEAGIYGGPLAASADGDLYTSGIGLEVGGLNHWIVRRMACE